MAYDLKPCPFCGGKATLWDDQTGLLDASCDECGCEIAGTVSAHIDWNTRAETTAYRLLRHIFAENSALRLPEGLADDELDLIKELRG